MEKVGLIIALFSSFYNKPTLEPTAWDIENYAQRTCLNQFMPAGFQGAKRSLYPSGSSADEQNDTFALDFGFC